MPSFSFRFTSRFKRPYILFWVMTSKNITESCSLNVGYISKSLIQARALLGHYKTRL